MLIASISSKTIHVAIKIGRPNWFYLTSVVIAGIAGTAFDVVLIVVTNGIAVKINRTNVSCVIVIIIASIVCICNVIVVIAGVVLTETSVFCVIASIASGSTP